MTIRDVRGIPRLESFGDWAPRDSSVSETRPVSLMVIGAAACPYARGSSNLP